MSIGPSGMIGSAAGSQLPQAQGTDIDRTQQETTHEARKAQSERQAENAAGVGQTEQDEQASDRDADGRRLWENDDRPAAQPEDGDAPQQLSEARRSKDASGTRGRNLDLTG